LNFVLIFVWVQSLNFKHNWNNLLIQSPWMNLNEFDLKEGLKGLHSIKRKCLIFESWGHVLWVLVVFFQKEKMFKLLWFFRNVDLWMSRGSSLFIEKSRIVVVFMDQVPEPKEVSVRVPKISGRKDGDPFPNRKLSGTQ